MSELLYKSDNLSIVGEIRKTTMGSCGGISDEPYPEVKELNKLSLIFTIHINGKIKTFTPNIYLEYQKIGDEVAKELSPINWNEWYVLCETLNDIGYPIEGGCNIIKSWINSLEGYKTER